MSTIDDELTTEERARLARIDALCERITSRPGQLGHAADSLHDAVTYTVMALHDDDERDTRAPADAVALVDEALGVLHEVRAEAVTENRRRLDAAMDRSEKLLGIDEEGTR